MADNSPQVQAAQLRQQQADAYAQAQQPAWMSAAAPAQLKPTGDPTDEEVVDKLNALSRGEEVEGDSMAIEDLAVERADAKYEKATGEKNFAHNLMNDMKPMLKSAFDSIKEGHKDAIDVIENNKRNEEQQKQQAVAAIFAFSSVVLAWAPVVSAAVAGLEASFLKTMQQSFPTMTSDNINLKTHLKLIKKFGESKVPIALNTTAKEAYTLTKTVSSGSAEVLGKQTDTLRQKVEHASYASMLEAAMNLEKGSGKASPEEIAALRTQLKHVLLKLALPNYQDLIADRNYADIRTRSKEDLLKQVVIENGSLDPEDRWYECADEMYGDPNKKGGDVALHAMEGLGGLEAFGDTVENPYEFAFGSINSSLADAGLSLSDSDIHQTLPEIEVSFGKDNSFDLVVRDPLLFKDRILDIDSRFFKAQSGPVEKLTGKYNSQQYAGHKMHQHTADHNGVNISDVVLRLSKQDQRSILDGKVIDFAQYELEFTTSGNTRIQRNVFFNGAMENSTTIIGALNGRSKGYVTR